MMRIRLAPPAVAALAAGLAACGDGALAPRVEAPAGAARSTLPLVPRLVAVATGLEHTCALSEAGEAYCWGANGSGQLGDSTFVDRPAPTRVRGGQLFTGITAGDRHTCAIDTAGAGWCWGENGSGQVGSGNGPDVVVPRRVLGPWVFRRLSAGGDHTCGINTAFEALCWGDNAWGQGGTGASSGPRAFPVRVKAGALQEISAGGRHTCAWASEKLSCWGDNTYGQLGSRRVTTQFTGMPAPVDTMVPFQSVDAGSRHTCAVDDQGEVWCWGMGEYGRLGLGHPLNRRVPAWVGGPQFQQVRAGGEHTCAVGVYAACWGRNLAGALGDGTMVDKDYPVPVQLPPGVTAFDPAIFDAGGAHTCAADTGGQLYCWGENGRGQLGNGTTVDATVPTPVS